VAMRARRLVRGHRCPPCRAHHGWCAHMGPTPFMNPSVPARGPAPSGPSGGIRVGLPADCPFGQRPGAGHGVQITHAAIRSPLQIAACRGCGWRTTGIEDPRAEEYKYTK
jgi:hypothetical protein